jgi:mRNA-degrading endonuclease RelE of RelBE toxin-antitoxin system
VSSEPWSVEFERRADRDLERLDPQVRQRVLTAIDRLSSDSE